jgi:hypothetical protein
MDREMNHHLPRMSTLPSLSERWTVRRKAALIEAVRGGWLAIDEVVTNVRTSQARNRCIGDQDRVPDSARVSDAQFRPELECRSDRQSANRRL